MRPIKPTAIKNLQGTARKDRLNPNEPQIEPLVDLPAAPDWLNEYAKDEWYTVVTWLHSIGLFSAIDIAIIAAYCQQMGVYREAESKMKPKWDEEEEETVSRRTFTTDRGFQMPSPWVAIGNKALMQALKIATEYGFTPSSRGRITLPDNKKKSKLDRLMKK